MMLDNLNDSRLNEMLLKQEEIWRDRIPAEVEWDEIEASLLVEDMLRGPQRYNHDYSQVTYD